MGGKEDKMGGEVNKEGGNAADQTEFVPPEQDAQ